MDMIENSVLARAKSFVANAKRRYSGKSRRWWFSTPLFASRIVRKQARMVGGKFTYSHPLIWRIIGSPLPAPPLIKRGIVRGYALDYQLPVFVETGTWHGDTTAELLQIAERLYSIELSKALYRAAQKRFENDSQVTLLLGDSGEILPDLVENLNRPCLFWLDGHFSGGDTVCGETETPIELELQAILDRASQDEQGVGRSVILIDDARDFGKGDYPPISRLWEMTKASFPEANLSVEFDIIRIVLLNRKNISSE